MEVSSLFVALIYVAFALPLIPLGFAWRAVIEKHPGRMPLVALLVLTLSYAWCLLVVSPYGSAIAPDYSNRRYSIIDWNIGAAIAGTFLAALSRDLRVRLTPAGVLVVLLWGYLGLVSVSV